MYAFCTREPKRRQPKTTDLALQSQADGGIRTLDPRFTRPRQRNRRKTTPSTNGLQTPQIAHVDPARSAFQSGPSRERLGQDWATRRTAGEAAAEIAGALRDTTSVVASALAVMRPEPSGRGQRRAVSASPPVSPLPTNCETAPGDAADAILASSTAKLSMGPSPTKRPGATSLAP